MLRFLLILLLFPFFSFGQNYIDSLKILPQNPDTSDIVQVVCYSMFMNSACTVDSANIILNPPKINVNVYYNIGISNGFCYSVDTITIGKLPIGNYTLYYNQKTNWDTITVTDSINFTVTVPTTVPEIGVAPSITIYPNPTTGIFIVKGTATEIQVYDLFGRLVLRSNKEQIDMGNYPAGIYMVRAGEAVRKLILR